MKLNYVIFGLGKIANRVADGIVYSKYANLYGVASKDEKKAINFAVNYKGVKAYKSYIEALEDEMVDVIYLATINKTHASLIKMCADYHKNIICEKPMANTELECKELFEYCHLHNVFLMEAQKAVFTPLTSKIHTLLNSGLIGDVKMLRATYLSNVSYPKESPIMDEEYGGCIKDIGVYPLAYANYIIDNKITEIEIKKVKYQNNIDIKDSLIINYSNGIKAYIGASFIDRAKNYCLIKGTKGLIIIENYWKNNCAYIIIANRIIEIEVDQKSEFSGEIDHAAMCIMKGLNESPIYGKKESMCVNKIIDEVLKTKIKSE